MNIETLYSLYLSAQSVTTDTRNIAVNSMFFALKGQNFNGNQYAKQAIEAGAVCAIVDEAEFQDEQNGIYLVNDSLEALQKLANYHRNQMNIPIISLTGSNGKTTTKELISQVLREKFNVAATIGNLNNHIGVPLTLLSINKNHDIAVVEMGANHQKEIEFLCKIAEPDYGYITNFGKAHLEGFGGEEGVIKGKSELYQYLKAHNKTVFVNLNEEKQIELTLGMKTIGFGTAENADYQFEYGESVNGQSPAIHYQSYLIQSELVGRYNLNNIAAAIAIGLTFEVPIENIKKAVESYKSGNNRSQIIERKDKRIVLDAYNANPSSMEAALRNFSMIPGQKAVFLGDMFELGDAAPKEHQLIADLAIELAFNTIVLVGQHFSEINHKELPNLLIFVNREELEKFLKDNSVNESNLMIKGSRGMALEKLLDFF